MSLKAYISIIFLIVNVLNGYTQSGLVFDEPAWDFGSIREVDGPVSRRFVCHNRGQQPEVILEVTVTCGCVTPEYSRKPILPGASAEIVIAYDPTNRPGAFSRELTVFTADRRIAAKLRITGDVVGRPKSPEELYPFDCGKGLRLEDNFHAFTYVYHGRTSVASIGYANLSDQPLVLQLHPKQASGLLLADYPRRIAPNERGTITFSYALPVDCPRYGTLKELLTVHINGQATPVDIFLHGLAVDDPKQIRQENAPKWEVNKNIINFGALKHSGSPVVRLFTLTNKGRSTLILRVVEVPDGVSCTLRAGDRLKVGESREVRISLDTQQQDYGLWSNRLVLIANDPVQPMLSIRLTAVLED